MMLESLEAIEEPPPFRRAALTALLGFWLLPFWCLSQAISNLFVFLWPFSNSLLLLLISLMTVVILGLNIYGVPSKDYVWCWPLLKKVWPMIILWPSYFVDSLCYVVGGEEYNTARCLTYKKSKCHQISLDPK